MNKWILYILHLITSASIFIFLSNVMPLHFETNDDIAMCQIANGCYTGTPDCHLIFINALFGTIVSTLYKITSSIEWYTLLLCLIHIFSFSILSYSLQNELNKIQKYGKLITIIGVVQYIIMVIIWARIIIAFQFTTTAGIACMAGCILLIKKGKLRTIVAILLILTSSLIRFKVAILVCTLMGLPILTGLLINNRDEILHTKWYKSIIARQMSICGVIIIGILGLHFVDKLFYQTDEWKEYIYYNTLRGHINDNPNAKYALNNLPEHISKRDYDLLLKFASDPEILTTNDLEDIYNIISQEKKEKLQTTIANIPHKLNDLGSIIIIIFALYILTISLNIIQLHNSTNAKNRTHALIRILVLSSQLLLFFAICGWISINATLKPRVFFCMIPPMVYMLWKNFKAEPAKDNHYKLIYISYIVLYIAAVGICIQNTKEYNFKTKISAYIYNMYQKPLLSEIPYNSKICSIYASLRLDNLDPWHVKDFPYHMLAMGWRTKNPGQKNQLENYKDLLKDDVYIFTSYNDNIIREIQKAILTHYGIKTKIVSIAYNKFNEIYRLETIKEK